MNTFSLEENQTDNSYSRKINLAFTDSAINKVAPALSGYVPLAMARRVAEKRDDLRASALPPFEKFQEVKSTSPVENVETTADVPAPAAEDSSPDRTKGSPGDFFEKDGQGYLISTAPDYKGKTKRAQQERFCLLYVWAYNLLNNEPVPSREHLLHAAQLNGVMDKNFGSPGIPVVGHEVS
jgi:hypothetical protein